MKEEKKTLELPIPSKTSFEKIWVDPVYSKVISVAFVAIAAAIWEFVKGIIDKKTLFQALDKVWHSEIRVVGLLAFLIIILVIYASIKVIGGKEVVETDDFDTNQSLGNLSFKQLYNLLLSHHITVPKETLSDKSKDVKASLLVLFTEGMKYFNVGTKTEDDQVSKMFLKNIAGPLLLSYGLVNLIIDSKGQKSLITSDVGYRFFALLQQYKLKNGIQLEKSSLSELTILN